MIPYSFFLQMIQWWRLDWYLYIDSEWVFLIAQNQSCQLHKHYMSDLFLEPSCSKFLDCSRIHVSESSWAFLNSILKITGTWPDIHCVEKIDLYHSGVGSMRSTHLGYKHRQSRKHRGNKLIQQSLEISFWLFFSR